MSTSIAITGCGVVVPRAMTLTEFADQLRSVPSPPSQPGRLPLDRFDPQQYLGQRGFKYLTPATQYALAAAQMALDDARFDAALYTPHERAVVVGTNFGVHAVLAGMDHVILESGAQNLRPMEAPNFSVNIPASHLSMKHKFTAFNVTLTTAQVAGLEAVLLAVDALRAGRARLALVCATEGQPPEGLEKVFGTLLAEGGACALVLESLDDARGRGADVRGEILVRRVALHASRPRRTRSGCSAGPPRANAVRGHPGRFGCDTRTGSDSTGRHSATEFAWQPAAYWKEPGASRCRTT